MGGGEVLRRGAYALRFVFYSRPRSILTRSCCDASTRSTGRGRRTGRRRAVEREVGGFLIDFFFHRTTTNTHTHDAKTFSHTHTLNTRSRHTGHLKSASASGAGADMASLFFTSPAGRRGSRVCVLRRLIGRGELGCVRDRARARVCAGGFCEIRRRKRRAVFDRSSWFCSAVVHFCVLLGARARIRFRPTAPHPSRHPCLQSSLCRLPLAREFEKKGRDATIGLFDLISARAA